MKQIVVLFTMAMMVVACDDSEDKEGTGGELNRGQFVYRCIQETSDSGCYNQSDPPNFPENIALGGWFYLTYKSNSSGSTGPALRVMAASDEHVQSDGNALSISKDGYTAFLSVDETTETVDIIHLKGSAVAEITLTEVTANYEDALPIDDVLIVTGETVRVKAFPQDHIGRDLAGTLDFTWTIEDEAIAKLGASNTKSLLNIEGVSEGITTLTVEVSGITREFDVEVEGEIDTGSDTEDDTETQSETQSNDTSGTDDTGTGTDTETDTEVK